VGEVTEHQTDLWIVRHGETEWSRSGQHTGVSDIPLTKAGEQAAKALRPRLEECSFDLVVSSPLQRARRTAELCGFPDVQIWGDVCEWNYGEYEGRTRIDIQRERPGWSVWADGSPGGESPQQVSDRVDGVISRVCETKGIVLLFAHGHVLRALAARWLEHPVALGAHLELWTTRISVLSHDRGTPTLELWNAYEPPRQ
jgi:probable phosphoglycerate mutase